MLTSGLDFGREANEIEKNIRFMCNNPPGILFYYIFFIFRFQRKN